MSNFYFTVFTPIYNRKHTIHRVWESLIQQTNKNFEWLIVDDGSEDGVEPLLRHYKEIADFPVRIFTQKNCGKHIAFNKAIDEAKGELLIPADSDDSFIPTTIEVFDENWKKFKDDSISGISVLCMDEDENIIGDKFPTNIIFNYFDIAYKYKIKGEKWGCIRVDVLRKYKFPDMFGANFFPESYIWATIGLNYKTVYLNIPLRVYFQDAGNQLMKVKKKSEGTTKIENFYTIWWINNILPIINKYLAFKDVLRKFVFLWETTFILKKSSSSIIKEIKSRKNKIIAILTFLPSFILFKVLNVKD